ncbi:hypothetical protein SAMN04488550_1247 [Gordonia malaquae]|uniref:hypothetical protein n=1 Tax=Gordonia malaquae TaxID=410332 RepID=UPI000346F3A7|nr:hypothetical protein [Gordonia malaquae]SEC06161.1 hypothetical protein SAMN04488550_1247 [Gordonia malaquae]
MNILRSASARRAAVLAVVSVTAVASLSACSNGGSDQDGVLAADRVTVSTSPSAVSSSSSAPSGAEAALAASFARQDLPADVGVALAPVGGDEVYTFGDQSERVAWSTIKVPLALAAQRKNGRTPEIRTAIIDSDNDAALALRRSLGTQSEGRKLVEAVIRDGGDTDTEVVEIKADDETFGLTVWPLRGAATFAANLPCLPDSKYIVGLMGNVASVQSWGIEVMKSPADTAVKGGWGPGDKGGYEVRQLGLITHKDGSQTAVAMSTYSGEPMDDGVAVLNKVGTWLNANLRRLPKGRC